MNMLIISAVAAGLSILILFLLFQLRKRSASARREPDLTQLLLNFQNELGKVNETLHDQNLRIAQQMNDHIRENQNALESSRRHYEVSLGNIENRLGHLQQATRQMLDIGKDISSLQDILQAPKLRGGLGELLLTELLRQILPRENYKLQYSFQTGSKVDAVILLGEEMVSVDAKFPLENFEKLIRTQEEPGKRAARKAFAQDVKKHIDDIAAKYILPDEGTLNFALMYIPAENVYYETIIKEDAQTESIAQLALTKKVIPVSPNSFYAYLEAIARGLKGMRIESSARMILEHLGRMESDMRKCLEDMEKVGGHLSHAQSAFDKAYKKMDKLSDKLSTVEGKGQPALTDTADV